MVGYDLLNVNKITSERGIFYYYLLFQFLRKIIHFPINPNSTTLYFIRNPVENTEKFARF